MEGGQTPPLMEKCAKKLLFYGELPLGCNSWTNHFLVTRTCTLDILPNDFNHWTKQAKVQQCLAQLFGSARTTTIPILGLVWHVIAWSGLSWPCLSYPGMA